MKNCENCGASLPPDSTAPCAACGTQQSPVKHVHPQKNARAKKAILALSVVAIVLTVLLVIGAAATTLLYKTYNSDDVLTGFSTALIAGDTTTLQKILSGNGVSVTQSNVTALCKAFTSAERVDALVEQMHAQANGETPKQIVSNAFSVVKEKVFLGYYSYRITVSPVSIFIPNTVQSPLLTVDGDARTGQTQENGVLYSGLFPGAYTCIVSAQTATGERLLGTETIVEALDTEQPTQFSGNLSLSDITIHNCQNDSAVISINGIQISQTPSDGTLTLRQVALGSTIGLSYTTDYGATITSSVQFTDPAVTTLQFETFHSEGGAPAEEEMNAILGTYFASYLKCINEQKMDSILRSTAINIDRLAATLSSEDHLANVFSFESATAQYGTVATGTYDGLPSAVVNVQFVYRYSAKEKSSEGSRTSLQTLEMVFVDGNWFVNRTVPCSEENFTAGILCELT